MVWVTERWQNWAGNHESTPESSAMPRDENELRTIVRDRRGGRIKAVGAGHSFTDVAVTDGTIIRLDHLRGIESVERIPGGGANVTVLAGTTLHELGPALWDLGLAMTNLGDIDVQTVAGAVSTGTHGTGARFGGIASQIRALRLVLASGDEVECDPDDDPELFEAARVGLGALGIVTAVTLRCDPAFMLEASETPGTLGDGLVALGSGTDHAEFYWFPHTDRALIKHNTRLARTATARPLGRVRGWVDDELLSNNAFELLNRVGTAAPVTIPWINKVSSRALSARDFTDRSYRVFASNRRVKFLEMEYAVPITAVADVLHEIRDWLDRSKYTVAFPVEVRIAAADDVWLSTAFGRDTGYIAVHQYQRRAPGAYFDAVESLARAVGGRPHWGKLHSLGADEIREAYPRFDDFLAVRDRVDPTGGFDNPYLRRVLGPHPFGIAAPDGDARTLMW